MPELPEVETVRRGLSGLLPGKKVLNVWHDWPRGFPNSDEDVRAFLIGANIVEVKRRAKVLLIGLDTGYSLIIHLKMTGQLVYVGKPDSSASSPRSSAKTGDRRQMPGDTASQEVERFGAGHPSDSLLGKLPDKSTRVVFDLGDARLFFNDQRKFGWVRLLPTAEIPNIDFFKTVGPEPLAADFTANDFAQRLVRRPKSGIKAVLLDQTIIAGVGNIYADEALYAAKIHPATLVKDLSKAKMQKLYESVRQVLTASIEKGGSTDRNYVDAEGRRGAYLDFAKVFRKQGQPCHRCGTPIVKIRVAGRGTHICPHCQKLVS